jgi:DNA modification methylase
MSHILVNGNNLDELKKYPDNYFDSVVTDPPYGLGKEPDPSELMRAWLETGYHEIQGKGFMGKEWDAFVPQPIFWKEVFRVLKHGGHIVAFFGTRTYDWGVMAMRFAGFEVRDCIQWLYGSGFPKSYNVAKGIEGKIVNGSSSWNDWKKLDGEKEEVNWGYSKGQAEQGYRADYSEANKERVGKVNFQTEEGKKWNGWGSALKPANEPIVLARKPLEKGLSIAENVLKWGTGGINIDGCRVGTENRTYKGMSTNFPDGAGTFRDDNWQPKDIEVTVNGRFPANIILTHHPECECKGVKEVKSDGHHSWKIPNDGGLLKLGLKQKEDEGNKYAKDGKEIVEDWNCHPDCPIKILDEQSGQSKSNDSKRNRKTIGSFGMPNDETPEYDDKGGASRFFYVAKASKSERNKGLEGFEEKRSSAYGYEIGLGEKGEGMFKDRNPIKQNFHPTVKPVKLMQYLVRLVTPPNGIVLDPFCGSGTTGVACKIEGFQFVGMEQDPEYTKIAEARIKNWEGQDNTGDIQLNADSDNNDRFTPIQTSLF